MSDRSPMFPLAPQTVFSIVREAARRAGLPDIRPHDLRRTTAKLMREGGASLEQVSKVLGHTSLVITQRYLGSDLELRPGLAATDQIRIEREA